MTKKSCINGWNLIMQHLMKIDTTDTTVSKLHSTLAYTNPTLHTSLISKFTHGLQSKDQEMGAWTSFFNSRVLFKVR